MQTTFARLMLDHAARRPGAAALRENLKRRKAQGRRRDARAEAGQPGDSGPAVSGTTLPPEPDAS